jgi:tetratricopeptide (TPR) repeat protein
MSLVSGRPRQKPNLDWRTLPIGPEEAFVLSQIDGKADLQQLDLMTGLGGDRLRAIVDRLTELGAIEFDGVPKAPERRISEPNPMVLEPVHPPVQVVERAPPKFDVRLLDEPSDLDLELRVRILELEAALPKATHYELLGVAENAEKREIKERFFTLINSFHVDKYFGKNLGIFRSKLERLSSALTKAHDTLSRNKTRQEYDAYLASRRETRGIRDSLPPSNMPAADTEDANLSAPVQLNGGVLPDTGPNTLEPMEVRYAPPDPQMKMRLLARRLGHRGASPVPEAAPPEPQAVDPNGVRELVAREMKARYDSRHGENRGQAQVYVDMAKAAESEGKWGSAINALRIALTLSPDSVEIKDLLGQMTARADRDLADKFADQARYEQRDGYYDRAMRSYERAGRGKESAGLLEDAARLFHEAAICAAREGADPKKIAELARRAVTAHGKKVEYRLDLARAYERLGMRSSALGEVQRALELDPQHSAAQALHKQLR